MNRSLFLGAGAALVCGAAACAGSSAGTIGGIETAAQFNGAAFARAVDKPADIRLAFDASQLYAPLLGAVMNALNGYQFGYAIKPERIALAVVAHGAANVLLYDDAAWAKYNLGATFGVKDPSGTTITSNIFAPPDATFTMTDDPNDPHGSYHRAFIGSLQTRGVVFTVCNTALWEQAQTIAASAPGDSVETIAQFLRSHLVPGAILVPSGISTIGLLQYRYHYAYATEVA